MRNPTLTRKEKIDAWLNLLQHAAGRFDTRRNFEWKISLGLWTTLLGAAHFLKVPDCHTVSLWLFLLVSVIYGLVWLPGLWQANDNDKNLIDYYRQQVEILLGVVHNKTATHEKKGGLLNRMEFVKDWSMQFQFAVTLILSILVWAYLNCLL